MKKLIFTLFLIAASLPSFSQCNNLFISEYVEGSSFNKSIEIYNPTGVNIPLTGVFSIRIYFNGSSTPTTIPLNGTINANSTFVISHSSASPAILALSNQTNAGLNFNGNDAVELFNSFMGAPADVIGVIGFDPGTEWLVNGVSGTQNHTLVRKPTVQQGNLVWTGSGETEWNVMPNDDITNLDAHTMNPCATPPPAAEFSWMNVCFGTAMPFADASSGGTPPYNYFWDFGDGSGTSNLQNPTYTYTAPGNYTVQLVVVDQAVQADTVTHMVTVYGNPTACCTPTGGNGCVPDTVDFINCSAGAMPLTFSWSFSNGNVSTVAQPQEIFTNDTAWFVLTVTDINGCVNTITDTGYMNMPDDPSFNYSQLNHCISDPNPTPTITGTTGGTFTCSSCIINASTGEIDAMASGTGCYQVIYTTSGPCPDSSMVTICITSQLDATITPAGPFCELGVPTNLTAADAGGTWSGNGIIDSNLGTFDASAAGVGNHEIIYSIAGNCGDADTIYIDVFANATVNIYNSDTTICNDIFGFFLGADSGGVWTGNGVSDMGGGNGFFSSSGAPAGVYYAVYSISGMCGDSDSIMITIYDYPIASFTYNASTGTVNFTDNSTNATTYSWDFDDGNTSTAQNPVHTFANNGTYNVCLTVFNAIGCSFTDCQSITITGVGIAEQEKETVLIYPNPAYENITITADHILSVEISDITGKVVYSENKFNSVNLVIPVSSFENGIYWIAVNTGSERISKTISIIK